MTRISDGVNEIINQDSMDQQGFSNDDEIDLFDLIDDIWNQKIWVFAGLFVTIILAGLYLFKAVPMYEVEAKVKSATANDLIQFSRPQLLNIYSLDVEGAFASAKSALLSTSYRKEFYALKLDQIKAAQNSYNDTLSLEQNFVGFNKQFSVKTSEAEDFEPFVQVVLKSSNANFASELLNDFVEYALLRGLSDSYDTMLAKVNGRIESLNDQARIMREEYIGDKTRRILNLKEAKTVALAVGQENPIYRNMDLVGGQRPPLYMLGSKAIKAEIKALESREKTAKDLAHGEDLFIKGLPKLLLEVGALQTLEIDSSKISLARIDELAVVPVEPIKPRKLLIMVLALVGGLFAGLFMALIAAAYGKHKIRSSVKRNV
jgi:chain length determinant protein (polysaccharide antigen chain regulator)